MSTKLEIEKLLGTLISRKEAAEESEGLVQAILSELFDRQLEFVLDPSRNKAALTTRRAGKTSMWARYCTAEAIRHPSSLIRIWHQSRLRAKQLLWYEFQSLFARHSIKVTPNETELSMRFANGSEIRLVGADKDKETQKKRGDKTRLEIVLEAQLFGNNLQTLVEDVAGPCLFDLQGTFCLEGTPGPLCTGYWFEVSGRNDSASRWISEGGSNGIGAGWSLHHWSLLQNPHLPHAPEELARIFKAKRWTLDNPVFIREYRGRWVNDLDVLYYKFQESRNTFTIDQVQPWGEGWSHSLGWDLGAVDDMALTVWGWHPSSPDLYEAFSWKKPGALSEEVMQQIKNLEDRGFNFVEKVADFGGGGRMYVEDLMARTGQVFKPSKKTEKYEHVRLFNDDLVTGHIKLQRGGALEQEMRTLPRDPDWPDPNNPSAPPKEDPRFANHCCFVAGTMVATNTGPVPIEHLRKGHLVHTRAGFKRVIKTAPIGVKPVITRLGLTGTPEHPVWTTKGWKRLDEIVDSDVLCTLTGVAEASALQSTDTANNESALVYAVSVEEQPEFFANGVLVSNCDAGLYAWRAARHYFHTPRETLIQPGTLAYDLQKVLDYEKTLEKPSEKEDSYGADDF